MQKYKQLKIAAGIAEPVKFIYGHRVLSEGAKRRKLAFEYLDGLRLHRSLEGLEPDAYEAWVDTIEHSRQLLSDAKAFGCYLP